jgi:hypothetical protein
MANPETAPAIPLTTDWINLYSQSGIPVGTQVIVTCRGKYTALVAESAVTPVGIEGVQIYPTRMMYVDEGSPGLWARADNINPHTVVIVQQDNNV